jgi:hypothetical protein
MTRKIEYEVYGRPYGIACIADTSNLDARIAAYIDGSLARNAARNAAHIEGYITASPAGKAAIKEYQPAFYAAVNTYLANPPPSDLE